MNCVVDASVFVASARASEVYYADSIRFLQQLGASDANVFCPTLIVVECSAAIARPTGDASFAESVVGMLEAHPNLNLESLTERRAHRAAEVAARLRLRGADAVYVALAEEFNATLITWDNEMLQRSAAVVPLLTPTAWIETQKSEKDETDTEASS
jgi:predicted nucleic acid-binding protein